ncbi:MAG: VCBS repeat-containing protein [Planctomycetales bacterium]|nr:VCBS repeat-containing protein [Planctomycetales bacterium]
MRMSKKLCGESLESKRYLTNFINMTQIHSGPVDDRPTLHATDFDNDGDVDLLSASYRGNKAYWHENDGNGNFDKHEIEGEFSKPLDIKSGDINGDGIQDVVVANFESGHVEWYQTTAFGDQRILARKPSISTEMTDVRRIEVVDIDADGDMDVIAAQRNYLRLFRNRGDGDFDPQVLVADVKNNVYDFAISDFNHDGRLDVTAVTTCANCFSNDTVRTAMQNSSGSFDLATEYSSSADVRSVTTGDFDADGRTDIVSGFESGTLFAFRQRLRGFEDPIRLTDEMNVPMRILAADMNGDGRLDLIGTSFSTGRVSILENQGTNEIAFSSARPIDQRFIEPYDMVAADFDGDGDLDIAVSSSGDTGASKIHVLEQRLVGDVNDDGRFNSSDLVAIFTAGEYEDGIAKNSTFETGDWNGDGEFNTQDLVKAFQEGAYSAAAVADAVDSVFQQLNTSDKSANSSVREWQNTSEARTIPFLLAE